MGYKGTLKIEGDIERILRRRKANASDMAITLQTTENHVRQGVNHLRKNVFKPTESIVTIMNKKKSTGKSCDYELMTHKTDRTEAFNQVNRSVRKLRRGLREIAKLNRNFIATTNLQDIARIQLAIVDLMTEASRDFALINIGGIPAKNI